MASLETNFNISPFYDDYDEQKNFHRILFRPAVPVQARELTQLQTILQNQIERFGDNIYQQGTVIKGCSFVYDFNYEYVKIKDLQLDGQSAVPNNYVGLYATDLTTGLNSLVVNARAGLESQDPDTNLIYIKYLNTGSTQKKRFANNETITLYNTNYRLHSVRIDGGGTGYSNNDFLEFNNSEGTGAAANVVTYSNGTLRSIVFSNFGSGYVTAPTVTVNTSTGSAASLTAINYVAQVVVCNSSFTASNTTPVGKGTAVSVGDGIIFQKGHFVRVDQQTVIVDKFTSTPNAVSVGFYTQESIVNNSFDSTLLDNAQGYSNYTAPGAFRLKLTPQLVAIPTATAVANTDFLRLLEFDNGKIIKRRITTEFNSIDTKLAQRTSEESGDYVVEPFTVNTETIEGNTTHLNVVISPGIAYVDGNRIEFTDTARKPIRKGTDVSVASEQSIATNYGNYVLVKEALGVFDFSNGATVNLRSAAGTDVTDNIGGTPSTPGIVIGTAKIRSYEYDSGTPGSPDATYRLYLFDIVMNSGYTFRNVRSIQMSGAIADVVLTGGVAVLTDTNYESLVFSTGFSSVNSIANTDFIYRTVTSNTFSTSGETTIQVTGPYDQFPYTPSSTLNSVQEQEFVVIPTSNAVSVNALSGTFTTNNTGYVTGGGAANFTDELVAGDYIQFSGNTTIFRVDAIINKTTMKVSGTGPSPTLTSNTAVLAFPKNIPIRLSRTGASITIGSLGTTATVDLGVSLSGTATAKIIHNVKVSPGISLIHKPKTVVKDVFVKISTSQVSAYPKGGWCLGIPDVLAVKGVYIGTGDVFTNVENTVNYIDDFQLDNGQSDSKYGLAYLKVKPGSTLSLQPTNCLLVKVDAFTHGSGYYITSRSYPVDDVTVPVPSNKIRTEEIPIFVSPKTGSSISLRDVVDFRPIVANTATLSATVAGATIDPATTETITGTVYFPTPNEIFEADVEYYTGRIDRVIIDKKGNLDVVEGVPGLKPVPPKGPDKSMILANVVVPPYPTLSPKRAAEILRPDYATLIKAEQIRRYTMKDIKQIEERIKTLEYYSLLNTLEKDTQDLVIPSEADPTMNRFKNGFFVDPMNTYDISDVNNFEYNITIDTLRSIARPPVDQGVFDLTVNTAASSNITKTGDLVTLSYDHAVFTEQPLATRTRNPSQGAARYSGTLRLFPEYDNYYDTTKKALKFTVDLSTPLNDLINTINQSVVFKADNKTITTSTTATTTVTQGRVTGRGRDRNVRRPRADDTIVTTTTNTTTTGAIRTGTTVNDVQQVGDFLTDFDFKPFIRAQDVFFNVTGLRPGAQHYVFFDKKRVTARQGRINNINEISGTARLDQSNNFQYTSSANVALVANSTGGLAGSFYIPENEFNVGQREVLIADIDNADSLDTSISAASAFFNAYNFSKEVSSLSMVTKRPSSIEPVVNRQTTVTTTVITRPRPVDPLAQGFFVDIDDVTEGVYLTKVDLYFKQKSSTKGVTVQLRESVDNGDPSPVVLAQRQLRPSDVIVSNNGTSATTVVFDTPVFVRNGNAYFISIAPEGNSNDPTGATLDYLMWTAETGKPDVATNAVDNGEYDGKLFQSSNDRNWKAIDGEHLKFKLYYAKFNQSTGTVVFENNPYEFIKLSTLVGSFVGGERVAQKSTNYITGTTFTGNTNSSVVNTSVSLTSSISAGDYLLFIYSGNTTVKTGTVTVASSNTTVTGNGTSFSTQYSSGNYILINGDVREIVAIANGTSLTIDSPLSGAVTEVTHALANVYLQVNRVNTITSTQITLKDFCERGIDNSTNYVAVQKVVSGVVDRINSDGVTIFLRDSNAANSTFLFADGNKVVGATSKAYGVIDSNGIQDFAVNYVEPHISTIVPNLTRIDLTNRIAGQTAATQTASMSFGVSNKTPYQAEVRSRSNEILLDGGNKSLRITANITKPTNTNKISPAVDTSPATAVVLQTLINNLTDNQLLEETTRYGSARVKYISQKVTLADGLDAEDLRCYLTAYKPPGTKILVYGKFLSGDDADAFENKDWTLLEQITQANLYSDSANEENYLEFEYGVPRTPPSTKIRGVVATNSNTTLTGSDTLFLTDPVVANRIASGDLVKIVNTSTTADYEIAVVDSVPSDTSIVLAAASGPFSNTTSTGFTIEKVTKPQAAFKYVKDGSITRYYDASQSAHVSYKVFAIKFILLADTPHRAPTVKDIRAIALSV